jgi:glycosyltransferase involved in cell wall biosynthesis
MDKITFCIPSRNNLRYLKNAVRSVRENSFRKDHDIIIFVDEDRDGTVDWLKENKEKYSIDYILNPKINEELAGVAYAYNRCVEAARTDVVMILHADMYLAQDADINLFKHLKSKFIVSATRIEPPLHPPSPDKIVYDFGLWPETDVEDGFQEDLFNAYVSFLLEKGRDKVTTGIFAPWMCLKEDYLAVGGHDEQFKMNDDIDIFNTFIINNFALLQSADSFVYHLTSRGWQFNEVQKTEDFKDTQKRDDFLKKYNDLIVEKWGDKLARNRYKIPIVYNKESVIKENANMAIIVPYRNREKHLEQFTPKLKEYLKNLNINYKIFIVEQFDDKPFNRGKLLNIGVDQSKDWADYFVFHDVDSVPADDSCDYSYTEYPTHISAHIEKFNYNLPYDDFFGTVCGINKDHFLKINGYSNEFWGWGIEDDDFVYRVNLCGIPMYRRSGKYLSFEHESNDDTSLGVNSKFLKNKERQKKIMLTNPYNHKNDGLSTLQYELISREENLSYIKIKARL